MNWINELVLPNLNAAPEKKLYNSEITDFFLHTVTV